MKKIVVGDVHGNEPRFIELMDELEIPASVADRQALGIEVIQLGDFLNLGYGQVESSFYERCRMYLDVRLMGNHELPSLAPRPQYVRFVGYEDRDTLAEFLFIEDWRDGLVTAAHAVGDWLITHAGISSRHDGIIDFDAPVADTAAELNATFKRFIDDVHVDNFNISMFEDQDSIFWTRSVKDQYPGHALKQIIGHTPQVPNGTTVPQSHISDDGNLYIIDIGAKVSLDNGIAALVTDDEGVTWDLVEVSGTHERTQV